MGLSHRRVALVSAAPSPHSSVVVEVAAKTKDQLLGRSVRIS